MSRFPCSRQTIATARDSFPLIQAADQLQDIASQSPPGRTIVEQVTLIIVAEEKAVKTSAIELLNIPPLLAVESLIC
jgi:hypothetical protein